MDIEKNSKMNILIENGIVLPMTESENSARKYFIASVGIKGNKIILVSSNKDEISSFKESCGEDLEIIDAKGKIVMPGFINTHTHVAMSILRGYSDDVELMEWLTKHIWPIEGKLTPDDVYVGAELGIAEMLLGGTTSFLDMYHFEHAVAKAAINSGIRAVLSPFFLDGRIELFEDDLARTIDICKTNSRTDYMIAPHAPYTCSDDTMEKGIEIAKRYNSGIHFHLAETRNETPEYISRKGESPTVHLCKMGLFDQHTVAAHGVHLTEEEMDILAEKHVTIAHNPRSNMKLASGFAEVSKLMSHGINVSIGTDGAASNNNLDMWEDMRLTSLLQKGLTLDPLAVPAYTALKMATVGGAKALGMEGKIGIIKEGALADIIIVNQNNIHHFPLQKNIISSLVYSCKSTDVNTTIVDGEILVQDGKLLKTDTKEIGAKATERLLEICNR